MKSLFWMKQIQGSVRVKINEYAHEWSEFLFVSLLVIFNFFPQINHFYYFTSLHSIQDVENHCAHLRDIELKTGRKIPYLCFPHVLFSIQLDWRAWNYKTKRNICLGSRKKDTQKDSLIFSAMGMRKRYLFCTSSHLNVPYEKQQEFNKWSETWNEYPC